MTPSRFWSAFEVCAKTVRTLLTTPQLTRPFREPFTPEFMRGEEWLASVEAEKEVAEPRIEGSEFPASPWWFVEAVKARARVETPLSATFTDELDDVSLSRQRFLDEQHGPDRICIFCFRKRSECTHSYQEMFAPKTPDAAGATVASVEDPSPDVPPASGEADSEPDWKALFASGAGRLMAIPEPDGVVIPPTVTRVVLVHGKYPEQTVTEKWATEWDVHIQDNGRTLKLFSKKPTGPRYEHTPGFFDLPGGLS